MKKMYQHLNASVRQVHAQSGSTVQCFINAQSTTTQSHIASTISIADHVCIVLIVPGAFQRDNFLGM